MLEVVVHPRKILECPHLLLGQSDVHPVAPVLAQMAHYGLQVRVPIELDHVLGCGGSRQVVNRFVLAWPRLGRSVQSHERVVPPL